MSKLFVAEGDLWLLCQEGGHASDAFTLKVEEPDHPFMQLANVITNLHFGSVELDDAVAEHFGAERTKPMGHRHIGQARLTIELLEEEGDDGDS